MTELHCLLRVQFDKIGSSKLIGCAWCLYLEAENINFSAVFESNTEMGIIKTEKKIKKTVIHAVLTDYKNSYHFKCLYYSPLK